MGTLGQVNSLKVSRLGPYGAFLDAGDLGEAMLQKDKSAPMPAIGDSLDVFVYIDIDDTLIASTAIPSVCAGQLATLEVVALTKDGAFMDWGLRSDLFVPRSEQMGEMAVGKRCVTLAMVDKGNQRMIGSTKLFRHLQEENAGAFTSGQAVDLMVCQRTEMGYKAVINGTHLGMLYTNEIFQHLRMGMELKGFVKEPREDGKIDLILQRPSVESRSELETKIIEHLKKKGGRSTLTDKSRPEDIYKTFSVSKKAYKNAIGGLFRSKLILLTKEEITLIDGENS